MQILHVIKSFEPSSGVAQYIMQYQRKLSKRGVVFNILTFDNKENIFHKEIVSSGGRVIFCKLSKNPLMWKNQIFTCIKNENLNIDLVEVHDLVYTHFIAQAISKVDNIPIIGHSHSSKHSNSLLKSFRNRVLTIGIESKLIELWGCSEIAIDTWFGSKSLSKKRVIPNAIDCKVVKNSIDNKKKISSNVDFEICHIGRLSPEKNQSFIIKIHSKLKELGYSCQTKLIGEGSEKYLNKLIEESKKYNIENEVIFEGQLAKKDVYEKLLETDFFLFPSKFEGFGSALVEAQALGVCSLASIHVPKETDMGFVEYLPFNIDIWVNYLIENKDNKKERTFNENLIAKNYCVDSASLTLIDTYDRIINKEL